MPILGRVSPGGIINNWPTFAPPMLHGCVFWVRADLGVTITSGAVSQWNDQSGQGHNVSQATPSNRPVLTSSGTPTGLPCLTFASSGIQTLTVGTAVVGASPWTMFSVHQTGNPGSEMFANYVGDLTANGMGIALPGGGPVRALWYAGAAVLTTTPTYSGAWEVVCGTNNGSVSTLLANGVSLALSSPSTQPLAPSADTSVGGWAPSGVTWNGGIAEQIIFNRVLLASEISTVGQYLAYRYGTATGW